MSSWETVCFRYWTGQYCTAAAHIQMIFIAAWNLLCFLLLGTSLKSEVPLFSRRAHRQEVA